MNKILYLNVNNSCNNNCIGCAIDPIINKNIYRKFEEIKSELIKGKKQGYDIFHPIGGEITLNPDLLKILIAAKKIGYKIIFTSNGRIFSYKKYSAKLKNLLDSINITLFGPCKEVHDKWTRVSGSFNQAIKGIKNLKALGIYVCINIPVWKENLPIIFDYLKILKKYNINEIGILMLGPYGRLKNKYLDYSPKIRDFSKLNEFITKANTLVETIDVEDFPLCFFRKNVLNLPNVHFQDISSNVYYGKDEKIETLGLFAANEKGYPLNSLKLNEKNKKNLKKDIISFKTKLDFCKYCNHNSCNGIYKEYLQDPKITKEFYDIFKKTENIQTMILNLTYKCNLNCKYCPTIKKNTSMTFETAKKAINSFLKKESPFYLIKFFGGEPLLEWQLIKKIISYVHSKKIMNIGFLLTTNGTLLNKEIYKFLNKNNTEIRVSIDGNNYAQNINRSINSSKIIKKISHFENITINMVISPNNFYNFYNNLKYIHSKGFNKFNFLPAFFNNWDAKSLLQLQTTLNQTREFIQKRNIVIENININNKSYLFSEGIAIDCDGSSHNSNAFLIQKHVKNNNNLNEINKKLDNIFSKFIESL